MNKSEIMAKASTVLYTVKEKLVAYSPEIMIGAGVIGGITSAVMACKATRKADAIGYDFECDKETIKREFKDDDGALIESKEYKKELTRRTFKYVGQVCKVYAPAAVVGGISIASILSGYNVLNKRTVALAASLDILNEDFKKYRERIVNRYGEEVDYEVYNGIEKETVKEKIVDENGKKKTVTKEVVKDYDGNMFTAVFHEGNLGFERDALHNKFVIDSTVQMLNQRLQSRYRKGHPGIMSYNEARKAFGFRPVPHGQIWGWVYDEENPVGDNYISVGMLEDIDSAKANFINGEEYAVVLNFNCDSNILKYMRGDYYSVMDLDADEQVDSMHYHQDEYDWGQYDFDVTE